MWRILTALGHPRAGAAANHPCRRHQRQGLHHRLHARDPGGYRASACMSIPRRISCASTSASGWARRAKGGSSPTRSSPPHWRMRARQGGAPITVFEITTAAGLLLFARHPADVLLLEVGMGGRLDATNVIERPLVTVITPVSFDHAEHLGDTSARSRWRRPASSNRACRRSWLCSRARPGGDRARGCARASAHADCR